MLFSGSLAHKCAADSNANALDSALDALVAFLGKSDEEYAQRCGNSSANFDERRLQRILLRSRAGNVQLESVHAMREGSGGVFFVTPDDSF